MTKPMTLWHASRNDIERPTIAGRIAGENHANSGLGIYCATAPHDYITGFGDYVHKMEVEPKARISRLSVRELQDMGSEDKNRAWFEAERERLSEKADILLVIEKNGYPSQAIILNDEIIRSSDKMGKDEFLAQSVSIMDSMREHDERVKRNTQYQAMQAGLTR